MYPNLRAEMTRLRINHFDIAEYLKKRVEWVNNRLQGKVKLDVSDAINIQEHFFPDCTINYLFASAPIQATV